MNAEVKKDIEEAIRRGLSAAEDNLYRANAAAQRYDPRWRWGESGQTLQQIIDGYKFEEERWKRALTALSEI